MFDRRFHSRAVRARVTYVPMLGGSLRAVDISEMLEAREVCNPRFPALLRSTSSSSCTSPCACTMCPKLQAVTAAVAAVLVAVVVIGVVVVVERPWRSNGLRRFGFGVCGLRVVVRLEAHSDLWCPSDLTPPPSSPSHTPSTQAPRPQPHSPKP